MSPAIPAFSSSRRSMRSIKLLSWSAATDSVLKAASSMAGPLSVLVRVARVGSWTPGSVAGLRFLEGRELRPGRLVLVARLPGVVRHAVDVLAALVLGERDAARVGGLLQPVRQAVAAEPGEVHQVDVLHVRACPQVLDEAPEGGG